MAKAPDAVKVTRAKRLAADEPDVTIKVDGESFALRLGAVTAVDAGAVRAGSGLPLNKLLAMLNDGELEAIAAVVFLSRRQAGEDVTWDEVAETITFDSALAAEVESGREAGTDPNE